MATAAKKPLSTVTLKHLAANLAESHELSKKQTEAVLGDLVGLVTKHLKKGDRIRIGGLGILQVRKRAARMGRNPATGEPIHIKASKKVRITPLKAFKDAVMGGGGAAKKTAAKKTTAKRTVAKKGPATKKTAPKKAAPKKKATAKKAVKRR